MRGLRALFQQGAPKWIGIVGLCVFLCCAGCALAVYIGDMATAPPINVQEADLIGVWKATYGPREIADGFCEAKEVKGAIITETLTLRADRTYEQKIEKGDALVHHIEGRRWWIERVASNSVWLHLDGGRFYPLEIWHLCLCDTFQRDGVTPPALCEYQPRGVFGSMDRAYRHFSFDVSKEVILPLYRPLFSKAVFLEYCIGDPDFHFPCDIHFYRLDNTRGSEE